MEHLDAWITLASFKIAIFGFFGAGNRQADEDEETAIAHELVLDVLSDADQVRSIELHTDENIRDQLSIEDAERLAAEAEEAKRGWFRN